MDVEHCLHPLEATKALTSDRFDAIVVDDQVPGSLGVLDNALSHPGCEKSVRIILAGAPTGVGAAFQNGAQIILYKPLSQDRVRHGLRAVRNLMARERRRGSKRVRVDFPIKLAYKNGRTISGKIEDLSDTGAAIRCDEPLPNSAHFSFECTLPDTQTMIQATAEVVWQRTGGMFGIRFTDVSAPCRKTLIEWLRTKDSAKSERILAAKA
ncbi:MAG TPA: PilZ domain-containing protein [Terriglobales bacterium]|nr:PilZ domain-containing protein [Terriglobales bacterium]